MKRPIMWWEGGRTPISEPTACTVVARMSGKLPGRSTALPLWGSYFMYCLQLSIVTGSKGTAVKIGTSW